jgi:hypothetical protein
MAGQERAQHTVDSFLATPQPVPIHVTFDSSSPSAPCGVPSLSDWWDPSKRGEQKQPYLDTSHPKATHLKHATHGDVISVLFIVQHV